ncbi:nipped-B-like protein B [Sardina pilchardus]|uniref:nipped-B-like protein B n=1 Tax=Sardina pilchardus TaxID=27697 RepID=UPI002E0EAD94
MASVYTITTGETLNTHERFKSHLPWGSCKNVSNSKDCDVILAFCPVTSRVGTDIEAALRVIPEGKPLALVVLHHTFDSNYTLPDTKRFMKRPDSITVDSLFTDDGLMRCPCNDDAVRTVAKFLQQHGKRPRGTLALGLLILILLCVAISTFSNQAAELVHTKKELERMRQNCTKLQGTIDSQAEEIKNYKEMTRIAIEKNHSLKEEVENYTELNRKANETIDSLKKEVENYKEFNRKANETIDSLKKEVENYKELDRKANKTIDSFNKEIDNCKVLDTEAKKEIKSLKKEVENCKELDTEAKKEIKSLKKEVENCKESNREPNKEIHYLKKEVENYKELDRKANEKIGSLEKEVKNCKELEKGKEKDKQPNEKKTDHFLQGVLLLFVLSFVGYVINMYGRMKRDDKKGEESSAATVNFKAPDPNLTRESSMQHSLEDAIAGINIQKVGKSDSQRNVTEKDGKKWEEEENSTEGHGDSEKEESKEDGNMKQARRRQGKKTTGKQKSKP